MSTNMDSQGNTSKYSSSVFLINTKQCFINRNTTLNICTFKNICFHHKYTSNAISYITNPFKTMTYLGEHLTSDGAVTRSFLQHLLSSAGFQLSGCDSRYSSTSLSLTNMMFPSKRSVILFLPRPKSASMLTIVVPSVWNQTSTLLHPFLSLMEPNLMTGLLTWLVSVRRLNINIYFMTL